MEYETLVGLSGDPVVDGGLVHPSAHSWPRQDALSLSEASTAHAESQSPQRMQTKMSRHSHDRETREQNLRSTIATRVRHDPENNRDTGIRVAYAPRQPQITHALATSCGMYTCRQLGP